MCRKRIIVLKKTFFIILVLFVAYGYMPFADSEPVSKAALGERLFFDNVLSRDYSLSCSSCHIPEFAFSDTVALSVGVEGRLGRRNSQSVMNMSSRSSFFYDGRAASLEEQVRFPIEDPLEMDFDMEEAVARIRNTPKYRDWFSKLYSAEPTVENVSSAIAAFIHTLETSDTPFDRYMTGTGNDFSEAAIRGRIVFMSDKARCFNCHFGPDFTGDEFRNIGLFDGQKLVDAGRFEITRDSSDLGKFKVPGLRNIGVTAPYMHDGRFKTLREVIDYYDNIFEHVAHPINLDPLLERPLGLTEQEKSDLEAFLHSLTDDRFVRSPR